MLNGWRTKKSMMLLENYRTEWTQRERDEIKKMKRERISIRHYGRRVSLCLPSQTGIEKSEGGEAWPKENRKLRSSISISTRDEGAKVVRRDGVRMENNDSMPDICRRGRDKINSPLNPLWKKSHRLPGINIREKKKGRRKKNVIRQTGCWSPCVKRQGQETWYFHVRLDKECPSKNREVYLAHPFFEFLWNSSTWLRYSIKMIIFYLYIAHLNSYLNSFQKNFHSNSSFTSFFFLLVNTTSSKETRRFPIKQLVYILRIAIESGNTRS